MKLGGFTMQTVYMNKRHLALVLAVIMAAGVLTACTPQPATTTAPPSTTAPTGGTTTAPASTAPTTVANTEPKVYRYSDTTDCKSLNIHSNSESALHTLMTYSHSGLYRFVPSADGKAYAIIGDIAKSDPYLTDSEGLVWRVDLREDAKWNNGDPINADTFMYSYKMMIDPLLLNDQASSFYNFSIIIKNGQEYFMQGQEGYPAIAWEEVGVKKVGEYSLEFTTTMQYTVDDVKYHFTDRTLFPVYEPYYEAGMNESRTQTTYGTSLDKYMGCGPYFFEEWSIDANRVFVKNPDHWMADWFKMDRVEIRVTPDRNARVQMWENGEVDYMALDAVTLEAYKDDPRTRIYDANSIVQIDINSFSTKNPILQTFAFRKAMYYAMDREAIAEIAGGRPAPFFIHYQAMAYPDTGVLYRDTDIAKSLVEPNNGYDPVKAKEYYDQAVAESGQTNVSLEIYYRDNNAGFKLISEFLQQELSTIFGSGFNLILTPIPNAAYGASRNFNEDPNCYDMRFEQWGAGQLGNVYPWYNFRYFVSAYPQRPNSYVTPAYDAAYEACFAPGIRQDREKVISMSAAVEKQWLEDVISIPLYATKGYLMYSDNLILPCDDYVPGFGYGIMFADKVQ